MMDGISESFGRKYCLHPQAGADCAGDIVRAHSIQRNGGLSKIAVNGHVVSLNPGVSTLLKTGCLAAQRIGVKQASTFTGFCNKHDTEVFRPLETGPYVASKEQVFLLAYRALCRESFVKRGKVEHMDHLRGLDRGQDPSMQRMWQAFTCQMQVGTDIGMREIADDKAAYDHALMNADFALTRSYAIAFQETPSFVCSGLFQPEFDFCGNMLQDLADVQVPSDLIALSVIPTETGGTAVLSWHGDKPANVALVRSLSTVPDIRLGDAVLRLAIEHCENVFFSPTWWDGLPVDTQQALLRRAASGMSHVRTPSCLVDDGTAVVTWSGVSRTDASR